MLPYEVFYRTIKNLAKTPEDEINFHAWLKNVAVSFKQKKQDELKSLDHWWKTMTLLYRKLIRVICNKNSYIERMKELIKDVSKFTDLHKEPSDGSDWLNHVVRSEERVLRNEHLTHPVFTDRQYVSIAPTGTKNTQSNDMCKFDIFINLL